jgi:hypothetical protein
VEDEVAAEVDAVFADEVPPGWGTDLTDGAS